MAQAVSQLRQQKELRRFVRFAAVGALGTVVDFGLLAIFKELLGLPTLLANTLSFSAGAANNFTLNRLWTYPDARAKNAILQLAQFVLVSVGGLLLNDGIVLWLEGPLGTLLGLPDYGYALAKVVATGLVLFWNFTANRLWTFGDAE
jgi:putative flippase GtrA